mmetsp:Transcript_17901/g.30438  ORF Transcript_17901/g.30438 Transcript_17901/m.30438 type:complete len:723 (+) Transcript_17901:935-3103(+)
MSQQDQPDLDTLSSINVTHHPESKVEEEEPPTLQKLSIQAQEELDVKEILKDDMVTKNFRGSIRQMISYDGQDGTKQVRERIIDSFAAILVRVVGFNELYDAWEQQFISVIEDFEDDSIQPILATQSSADDVGSQIGGSQIGESQAKKQDEEMKGRVQAIQNEYLETMPRVLCLQLNRLEFSQTEMIKHRHKVEIYKSIMADRFLTENKDKVRSIREHVTKMREQIRHLEDSIKEYTNFGGSESDIRSMLFMVQEFFLQNPGVKLSSQEMTEKGHVSEEWKEQRKNLKLNSFHPFLEQIDKKQEKEVGATVQLLKKFSMQLGDQVSTMEKQLQDLKQSVKSAYGQQDLQQHEYHLHSVCVHDGNASSGHYYSLIYDRFEKKWRKYSDIKVTEVTEEEVLQISMGDGKSWQTAYWLVYVNSEIAGDLEKIDLNLYQVPQDPKVLTVPENSYYALSIPKDVVEVIHKENVSLACQIEEVRNQRMISELKAELTKQFERHTRDFDVYQAKLKGIQEPKQNFTEKINIVLRGGFPAYFWFFVTGSSNSVNILKRLIFERVFAQCKKEEGFPATVDELVDGSPLAEAILKTLKGKDQFPSDGVIKLSVGEREYVKQAQAVYLEMVRDAFTFVSQVEEILKIDADSIMKQHSDGAVKIERVLVNCFHNFTLNGCSFDYNKQVFTDKYNFRNITKDSMRCYLLFLSVCLKKYLQQTSLYQPENLPLPIV